ncbi:MAG TPA: hypothetical protein VI248_14790 [Kineosporiaceae bacterium]
MTVTELRDSSIWAATCDLKAQVLHNDRSPVLARAAVPWVVLVALGVVVSAVGSAVVGGVLIALGVIPLVLLLAVVRQAGHLMLEADGFTYRPPVGRTLSGEWDACGAFRAVPGSLRVAGHVAWKGTDDRPGAAFLPGAGGLPPEDLAVLLNRYRQRFARDGSAPD